jgi:uncharacterized protein
VHTIEERGFYLPASQGELFCYLRCPRGPLRGRLVLAPPFAEEVNKCRRMVALAARALAEQGWAVLVPDLFGTGDADGEFGDATWAGWVDDLRATCAWSATLGEAPLWLWGARAGALLASGVMQSGLHVDGLLLWQPQLVGRMALGQFLRLKMAASFGGDSAGTDTRSLRQALIEGHPQEIAGYTLAPALAEGLDAATFHLPADWRGPLHWLEVGRGLTPASTKAIDALRAEGRTVNAHCVDGPAFWQTVEVELAPALIAATSAALGAAQ